MRIIDADALKEELLRMGFFPAIVKAAIERMPTVDAIPVVHGFWIHCPTQYTEVTSDGECRKNTVNLIKCSVCGAPRLYCSGLTFCEYCGAKMDGGWLKWKRK